MSRVRRTGTTRPGVALLLGATLVLLGIAGGVAFLAEDEPEFLGGTPPAERPRDDAGPAPPPAATAGAASAPMARAEAAIDDDPYASEKLEAGLFELAGRAVAPDGKPVPGATVKLYAAAVPIPSVAAIPALREAGVRIEEFTKKTGSDGRFRIRGPFADASDPFLLARAKDFAPVTRRGFALERGAATDVGDVTLETGFQIAGRVLDPNGNPVAGAHVAAVSTPNLWAVERFLEQAEPEDQIPTNDEGAFAIPHLSEGRYTVVAWARGLARGASPPVVLAKDHPPEPVQVDLAAGGSISGMVVSAEGSGVSNARVLLRFRRQEGWNPAVPPAGEDSLLCDFPVVVTTDGAGSFEADGLVLDREYRLSASADGYRRLEGAVAKATSTGLTLTLLHEFEIRGKVVDAATGAPVPGAQLARFGGRIEELRRGLGSFPRAEGSSDAQGNFVVHNGDKAGRAALLAWFPNPAANPGGHVPTISAPFEIAEGQKIPEVSLPMERGAGLAGSVISAATGEPLRGASVSVYSQWDPRSPNVRQYSQGGFWGRSSVDAGGGFRFDGLLPGFYIVEVRHPSLGGTRGETIQLGKEERREGMRIAVPIPGTIRGIVLTTGSVAAVRVTATRADGFSYSAFCNSENQFTIPKIPAGLYRVRADKLTSLDELVFFGRGGGMAEGSVTAVLADGQTVDVTLEIPDSALGKLVGSVLDDAGPCAGSTIVLLRENPVQPRGLPGDPGASTFGNHRSTTADILGAFEFAAVKEGYYRVYAVPRGRAVIPKNAVASEAVQVFGNGVARRDLYGRSSRVTGKVLRPSGQPLNAANVVAIANGTRGPSGTLPPGTRFQARTRGDGSFDFGRLPGGAYDITVEQQPFPKKTTGIEIYGGRLEPLSITLDAPGKPGGSKAQPPRR